MTSLVGYLIKISLKSNMVITIFLTVDAMSYHSQKDLNNTGKAIS